MKSSNKSSRSTTVHTALGLPPAEDPSTWCPMSRTNGTMRPVVKVKHGTARVHGTTVPVWYRMVHSRVWYATGKRGHPRTPLFGKRDDIYRRTSDHIYPAQHTCCKKERKKISQERLPLTSNPADALHPRSPTRAAHILSATPPCNRQCSCFAPTRQLILCYATGTQRVVYGSEKAIRDIHAVRHTGHSHHPSPQRPCRHPLEGRSARSSEQAPPSPPAPQTG